MEKQGLDSERDDTTSAVILFCEPLRKKAAGCLLMQAGKSPGFPRSSARWEPTAISGQSGCGAVCVAELSRQPHRNSVE